MGAGKRGSSREGFLEVGRQGRDVAVVCFRWYSYLPWGEASSSFRVLSPPQLAPPSGLPRARSGLPQLQRQPGPMPVLQTKDGAWALLESLPRQRWRWGLLDSPDPRCSSVSVPLTGSCLLGRPSPEASHESHMTISVAGDLQRRQECPRGQSRVDSVW